MHLFLLSQGALCIQQTNDWVPAIQNSNLCRVDYAGHLVQGHQVIRVWNLSFRPDFGLSGYAEPEETEALLGLILMEGHLRCKQQHIIIFAGFLDVCHCFKFSSQCFETFWCWVFAPVLTWMVWNAYRSWPQILLSCRLHTKSSPTWMIAVMPSVFILLSSSKWQLLHFRCSFLSAIVVAIATLHREPRRLFAIDSASTSVGFLLTFRQNSNRHSCPSTIHLIVSSFVRLDLKQLPTSILVKHSGGPWLKDFHDLTTHVDGGTHVSSSFSLAQANWNLWINISSLPFFPVWKKWAMLQLRILRAVPVKRNSLEADLWKGNMNETAFTRTSRLLAMNTCV